jgi:hypothetical protein
MPSIPDYCVCTEHSGVTADIKNIKRSLDTQGDKIEKMFGRINVVLGSVCVSLVLIIIDIILRVEQLK